MKTVFTLAASTLFVASAAVAEVSPETVSGAATVAVEAAADLFSEGAKFVDVRKDADIAETGRIRGAIHLNSDTELTETALAAHVGQTDPVVFYCNGHSCMRSSQASEMAVSWGYTNVKYFRDGFPAWYAAGLPTE
ncbi:rhodanese-like domain-containing protein [Epibacterium ulvae]|uniref:Rhodanese-related sulfurtransferase n=1 Tax=Epibacterium ulvae TaxID=1156985 RepID=A0A1G5R5B0_9RHOB|nr:rhodanese-like domain-containing protein [Epibacterium ulvae]SCZ69273.1 Rhodanese-related sulfurtransferase [Epibacterium ulvae]